MGRLALLFHDQPRLLWLLVGVILVSGLTATQVLPRMEDPLMKPRAATIRTVFPGASTQRVDTLVTDVIERRLMELEDIRLIRSGSRTGYSLIALELRDEIEDVEPIWGKIRDKLADAQPQLPAGVEPEFENLEFRATTMLVSVRWQDSSPTQWAILNRLAKELQAELRGVLGTDKVELYGLPEEQVVIEISQAQMAEHGLTIVGLAEQLRRADAKVSAGNVQDAQQTLLLEMAGDFDSLQRLAAVQVGSTAHGRSLSLGEIATLRKTIQDPTRERVLVEGRDAIELICYQRHNRRIDLWTRDAEAAVARFAKTVPSSVAVEIDFRQSRYVMQRLTTLLLNLGLGAMAVMVVVLLLMGWRGSLLVGLTLPLTCLAVLGSMWIFNIPLHQMSVTGMILALGLLIDNAIVIVDEVQSALDEGLPIREAIRQRVEHLAVPLGGSTLTTVLAFAPLILMIGPAAEFVYAIATSVIAAVAGSYFLSMTVVPALLGWLRRAPEPGPSSAGREDADGTAIAEHSREESLPEVQDSDRGLGIRSWWVTGWRTPRLAVVYRTSLRWLFQHPVAGIAVGLALPLLGFGLAGTLPEQFFPSADRDQFTIKLELPAGKTTAETMDVARQARDLLLTDPNIARVDWYVGRSAPPFYVNLIPLRKDMSNFAQAFVELKSGVAEQDYLRQWQNRLQSRLPMGRVNVQQLQLGPPLDDPIEIRIFGPDPAVLTELGAEARQWLSSIPHVTATTSSLGSATPVLGWEFDPQTLAEVQLDRETLANQLSAALDGVLVGAILDGEENVPVRLRLAAEDRSSPARIAALTINQFSQATPLAIPLSALGDWRLTVGDAGTQRINNRRVNEVRAQVETGHLPSVALARFQALVEQGVIDVPPGYEIRYGGESEERDRAVTNLLATAPVLVLIMFSVIVLSFSSFRAALLIGGVGVLSIGLGLFALVAFGFPFGFMSIVGTMGLVGVAINDSIVVLAGLLACPRARQGDVESVVTVVMHSTRHIIATSLTTIAGFLPLLWQGGGFWPPLAVAIAGGVGGATLLALYFVPALYLLSTRFRR
jgi:multidrug efflux pump subunit AcrB